MFKSYQFTFRPFLTLFCLLMISVFVMLGTWQVLRAYEKEQLQEEYDQKQRMPRAQLSALISSIDKVESVNDHAVDLTYRKVESMGQLLNEHAFFVDNVIMDGKPGYLLHTPLLLADGRIVLVNRGWVVASKTRGELPPIDVSEGQVAVSGSLVAPRSKPVLLGDLPKPNIEQEQLWFYVDLDYLSDQIDTEVLPWVLELDPKNPLSLMVKVTQYDAKVGMHIGYAIQWYVFILFVLIGFLAMSVKRITTIN